MTAVLRMLILLAHEMGHFMGAQFHSYRISWPWFLPFPLFLGTLGAFIRFTDKPPHRSGLIEMAALGPLSGFVVIVACLVAWLSFDQDATPVASDWVIHAPLIFSVVSLGFGGDWISTVSVYDPIPFAAWIGCLITSLNLLPVGQLDGGHL